MRLLQASAVLAFIGISPVAYAQTDIKAANPYLCYVVERISGGDQIPAKKLRDQFDNNPATVLKPRYVCNPVEINGKRPPGPRVHITCYEVTTAQRGKSVTVANEFGSVPRIELGEAQLLCMPSSKKIVK